MPKDPVVITIKNGIHPSHKYPVGEIKILLKTFFEKANMKGVFQVTLGARRRGRNHMRRINVIKENGSSVEMKIKPGNNDTCCEVRVIVPSSFSGKAFAFLEILRETAPHMG